MGTHQLILTENCENELMVDIFRFTSSVILEIQKKFPVHLLLNAMQILNLKEWLRNKEELLKFEDVELEELIRFYKKSYLSNYSILIIDSENIRNEWYFFKKIVY
ncbi:5856_t:CDS:1 [Funneliformis mosseae]|uniref:5856_t:CDS:1 n=1 Tax=Funneliformis mosseae TaxID=27381 RepID=A0A9N9CRC7_FUNMO|nr:5856_t:CDS:1 [Funneliformis mosseae]